MPQSFLDSPVSPLADPDSRYLSNTIREVDAKLEDEGKATGLDVWEQVEKAYVDRYLDGDSELGYAQLASLEAAILARRDE